MNSPMENPWAGIVGPETDRDIAIFIETSTDSIPDNWVVEIVFVTFSSLDNPELVL